MVNLHQLEGETKLRTLETPLKYVPTFVDDLKCRISSVPKNSTL